MLMKCVALHNAPLLHQHSCRRMDSGALNARDQLPPAGFYAKILVRAHPLKARFLSSPAVQRSLPEESQQMSVMLTPSSDVMPGYRTCTVALSCGVFTYLTLVARMLCSVPCSPLKAWLGAGLAGAQRRAAGAAPGAPAHQAGQPGAPGAGAPRAPAQAAGGPAAHALPLSDRHPCCPKVSVLMIGRRVAPCVLVPGTALYAPQHMSMILLLVREIMHAEELADSVCTDADGE